MAGKKSDNFSPRIANRRALHDYTIIAKLECGMALMGSEVKSLRGGRAQLQEAYAAVENGQLILYGCHIEPYLKAAIAYNHDPLRPKKLLAHKREIAKLAEETKLPGTTLIPLAIYFKDGRAKVELAVGRGRNRYDKRDAIRKKEMARELRRAMTHRQ